MDQNISDKIFMEKDKKLKKNRNRFLKGFLFVFIAGYLLFFSSNVWYPPDYKATQVTKLNVPIVSEEREVTVLDWVYSEKQEQMEVEIQIDNKAFDGKDKYKWSAVDRKKGPLKVETVIETDDYVVLHIDLPSKWTIVSLRMGFNSEETGNITKLYTQKKAVTKVAEIKTLTLQEYMLSRQDKNIQAYQDTIDSDEKKITSNQKKIVKIKQDIAKYKADQEYETDKQKEQSDSAIATLEAEKQALEDENVKLQEDIEEMKQRIEKAELKKQEYQ